MTLFFLFLGHFSKMNKLDKNRVENFLLERL